MNYSKKELQAKEAQELRIHRIRTKLVSFKELSQPVIDNQAMSYEQFLELNIAATVSNDYNDSLTLNKFTVMFPVPLIS